MGAVSNSAPQELHLISTQIAALHDYQAAVAIRASGEFMVFVLGRIALGRPILAA
jgi:hypothetical protein